MRNLIAFVVAVLLGGALVFVLSREMQKRAPAATEAPTPPEPAAPEIDAAAQPAKESASKKRPSEPADEIPAPAPAPTMLAGTLVVLDERGGEHAQEDGILALGLGTAGAFTQREVEVQDGRWSLPLVARTDGELGSMAFRACVLGKQRAVPAPGQAAELPIPPDGQVELRVQWQAAPLLHVRARDTGAELGPVTLYELPLAQRGSSTDLQHPGTNATAAARAVGHSPVRLEAGTGLGLDARVLYAKSPGYGWGRIEVPANAGEELTLALDPAGALELAVVGEPEDTGLEILVLEAAAPHAEVLDLTRGDTKTFVLADLRAGRYVAEARHSGLLTGALEIEVTAGAPTQAILEVGPPPSEPVALEGVLVVPEAWQIGDFILEFLLQGRFDGASLTLGSFEIRRSEMALEAGSRERFRWTAARVLPARYLIYVSWAGGRFITELDTGPSGTRDARIELPPPGVVSLRWSDEESGATIEGERVLFAALTPRAFEAKPLGNASKLELQVPQGKLLIFTRPLQYEPAARLLEVGPGTNEILLPSRKKP